MLDQIDNKGRRQNSSLYLPSFFFRTVDISHNERNQPKGTYVNILTPEAQAAIKKAYILYEMRLLAEKLRKDGKIKTAVSR